ncbi:hypothetical protein [uncultured Bartonella sp.]|uniref:hypothetical protein n=1 Tax=uncultured Bartonella sp. TaxID=104108 RepID=UPI0025CC65BC|nr:hypothetical protein [uncultured Bartonella sp.]
MSKLFDEFLMYLVRRFGEKFLELVLWTFILWLTCHLVDSIAKQCLSGLAINGCCRLNPVNNFLFSHRLTAILKRS